MKYTFRPTKNKARRRGWRCGKGSGATKKKKFHSYIPASVPGPSPAPSMSATAPQKRVRRNTKGQQHDIERKKKALTFSDKIKIIDHMRAHRLTQKQAAEYWDENGYQGRVTQKNISVWLKNEDRIRAEVALGGAKRATRRIREVKFPALEAALTLWVESREAMLQPITGPLIVAKAERLSDAMNLPHDAIKFSNGWIDEFKRRHSLQHYQNHGEAGSVNLTSVKEERVRMRRELQGWDLNDVFNADETSFFWKSIQNNGLSTRGLPGKKLDKTRMSVLVMMNATGTEKIRLLFIATAKRPRCFGKKDGRELGLWYFYNKKAWMTGEVFSDALEELDERMKQTNRKILLLIDNFSGHKWREDKIKNIQVLFFSPNLTPFVQPADAGIIRCLKSIFRKLLLRRSLDREDAEEDDIFAINQLEAMRLLEEAWRGVTQSTIVNCWRHTGILPSNDEEPSNSRELTAEPDVEFEVQEATDALQRLNLSVSNREGSRHLLPRPCLVDDIEELLAEPAAPEWDEDASEIELLNMVRQIYHSILHADVLFSWTNRMMSLLA